VTFLALFLIALFRVKSVNLAELATGFLGSAKLESSYKRRQRFMSEFELNDHRLARLVAHLMAIPQPWVLSIDRTNWEFGDQVFNILMLGIVHNGVAFPLLGVMLDKKGNSNTQERQDLLDQFFEVFPDVEVAYLTADREKLYSMQPHIKLISTPLPQSLLFHSPIPAPPNFPQSTKT
jgi:hypothetical protein